MAIMAATPAGTAALQESFLGVEAEGLPDAAQGDVKGAEIQGGIEEAVQAGIQEFEFFQEGGLAGGVLPLLLHGPGGGRDAWCGGRGRRG